MWDCNRNLAKCTNSKTMKIIAERFLTFTFIRFLRISEGDDRSDTLKPLEGNVIYYMGGFSAEWRLRKSEIINQRLLVSDSSGTG